MTRRPNAYRVLPGGIIALELAGGYVTLIDAADLAIALTYRWVASSSGSARYARSVVGPRHRKRGFYLHRLLLPDAPMVDHRNGDGLDNRRANLRPATSAQNAMNARRDRRNTSGFRGVSFLRRDGVWCAKLAHEYLGRFPTAEAAARAYDEAAFRRHGTFARLNFPALRLART